MTDLIDRLRGIVTVLNTPFTADDAIDVPSLRRNIESALAAGVAGFLIPALASEVNKLSAAERLLLVQATLETVDGRAVVIGGASASDASERLAHARALIDLGCDGVLANIAFTSDDDYTRQVEALATLDPGFLMLQDWDFGGYGLPIPLIVRLFDTIPAFQSLKIEVVPAGVKYSEVIRATNGRLHVAGGWAVTQMIEALDRGVHTLMPTGLHAVYTRIDRLHRAGERDAARALFNRVLPILAFSNQHLDISIHFFKRLLHRQGLYTTARVRQPILPFDEHHARSADELIDTALILLEDASNEAAG